MKSSRKVLGISDTLSSTLVSLIELVDFSLVTPDIIHPIEGSSLCFAIIQATTDTNAVATIYLTSDKTITGTALFSIVYVAIPIAKANVAPGISTPQANLQANDNKIVNISTTKGQALLFGLVNTVVPAPNTNTLILVLASRA